MQGGKNPSQVSQASFKAYLQFKLRKSIISAISFSETSYQNELKTTKKLWEILTLVSIS